MKRLERLHALLVHFQNRRIVKANELAEVFGITLRTVYRDIKALQNSGVPIQGEAGVGYSIARHFQMLPIHLTESEGMALLAVSKFIARFPDENTRLHFEKVLLKIRASSSDQLKDQLEILDSKIKIPSRTKRLNAPLPEVFLNKIRHALLTNNLLEIDYVSLGNPKPTKRKIEPMGLVFYADHWHLIAWCRERNDYRDFRVDRIQCIENLTESCLGKGRISLEEYGKRQWEKLKLYPVKVLFHQSILAQIKESKFYWGYTGMDAPIGDWRQMNFAVPDYDHFARWLLGFTNKVKIQESEALNLAYEKCKGELFSDF